METMGDPINNNETTVNEKLFHLRVVSNTYEFQPISYERFKVCNDFVDTLYVWKFYELETPVLVKFVSSN